MEKQFLSFRIQKSLRDACPERQQNHPEAFLNHYAVYSVMLYVLPIIPVYELFQG